MRQSLQSLVVTALSLDGPVCDGTLSCIAGTCVQAGSRGNPCRTAVPGAQSGPVCDDQLTCLDGRCVQYTKMPAE